MELKIVKFVLQNENTKPENRQYGDETWCVDNYMYREGDGGMSCWYKELDKRNPSIVYLYDIRAVQDKIGAGVDENGNMIWIDDIIYHIRAYLKVIK